MIISNISKEKSILEHIKLNSDKIEKEIVYPSISKNPDLIGTAFDYFFRLKNDKNLDFNNTIAKKGVDLILTRDYVENYFKEGLLKRFNHFSSKLKNNIYDIESLLNFSKLDKIYRELKIEEAMNIENVKADIEDFKNIQNSIFSYDYKTFISNPQLKLGDIFGDADFIVDDILFDIKTTKSSFISKEMLAQIVCYGVIAKENGFNINKVGFYFPRYNEIKIYDLNQICDEIKIKKELENLNSNKEINKKQFNEKQLEFISSDFPILCIANPGSGKTESLSEKVIFELKKGVPLEKLLILTFTNKAGNEILERIKRKMEVHGETYIGTFHSVFYKILKNMPSKDDLGGKDFSKYSIITPNKDYRLFKEAFSEIYKIDSSEDTDINKFLKEYEVKIKDLFKVGKLVNKGIFSHFEISEKLQLTSPVDIKIVYKRYIEIKEKEKLVSFSDILMIFRQNLEDDKFSNEMKSKFKFIFVDEFQDTNKIQMAILNKIQNNSNICVIGDPFQSIYSFLDANIENILNFVSIYNPNIIQFTKNYRSTENIVKFTNNITREFLDKKIFEQTNYQDAEAVMSENFKIKYSLSSDVSKYIINEIQKDINYIDKKEIAVIFRKNSDSRNIERNLINLKIPFTKLSGTTFYEKDEIQSLISCLLFWIKRDNYRAFQIFCEYAKGIDKKTYQKVFNLSKQDKISVITSDVLNKNEELMKFARKKALIKTLTIFENPEYKDISEYNFKNLIKELGFIDNIIDKAKDNLSKMEIEENIKLFFDDIRFFFFNQNVEELNKEMDKLLLEGQKKEDIKDGIILTTAHSAKGLEFEKVFLLTPTSNYWGNCPQDGFELKDEQIRLLYVAVSRAKKYLDISGYNLKEDYFITKLIKNNKDIVEKIDGDDFN